LVARLSRSDTPANSDDARIRDYCAASSADTLQQVVKIGKPQDRGEWSMVMRRGNIAR
jgi:hypothetical protein